MRILLVSAAAVLSAEGFGFPNVCTVAKTPAFHACLEMNVTYTVCGELIPRPCAIFSYYVPQYFIEVVSHPAETFFRGLPAAETQLATITNRTPFAAEDDHGSFSYHGHTIIVPFVSLAFRSLPCGDVPSESSCFGGMSEHLGRLWRTGEADWKQPLFLAWQASPKACLLKGAAMSLGGESRPTGHSNAASCSSQRSWMKTFPVSNQPVCSGWGIHFPRSGTVTNSDQTTASLVIASRMRSLSSEVFQAIPSAADEKWQMIYPQPSSCFREGQNIAILRANIVNESQRLGGRLRNYLYVVWKRVTCRKEINWVPTTYAALAAIPAACQGVPD